MMDEQRRRSVWNKIMRKLAFIAEEINNLSARRFLEELQPEGTDAEPIRDSSAISTKAQWENETVTILELQLRSRG